MLFRFVADPEQCVEVSCERGTTVVFDNTVLEHSVPTRAHRAFFGPFLVRGAGTPPAGEPRGGDLCCRQGVETCCGNMCDWCRAERAEQLRRADSVAFLRHAFTYKRARTANARIRLVEQDGEPRVSYNGRELHGSWCWLEGGFLEINFNARPQNEPLRKIFEWSTDCWRSVVSPGDEQWQVTLIPEDPVRDAPESQPPTNGRIVRPPPRSMWSPSTMRGA